MLIALALSIVTAYESKSVEPHIVAASMFKNGYAVVSREFEAPVPGTYTIAKIPSGSLGTLWFSASDGTKLDSVEATTVNKKVKNTVGTIDGILGANVGHEVRLGFKNGDKVLGESQQGKIVTVGADFVLLQQGASSMVVPKMEITSLQSVTGQLLYQTESDNYMRVLQVKTSGKPGHVHMISLEHGLTWAPAYAIDISDPNKLNIVAKATVMNDLEDFSNIDARFVTGFPNVPFSVYLDPLIHGGTVRDFTQMLNGIGNPNAATPRGRAGESFGGQGQMATQNGLSTRDLADAMDESNLTTSQEEDLFFYKHPKVTTKRGDRSYHILFSADTAYEDLYTWDVSDVANGMIDPQLNLPEDVWHTIRFKNSTAQPFTTAVATVFKNGEILGQDMMHYVSVGSPTEVKITKALDVHAEMDESESKRERGAIKSLPSMPMYDLVTMNGTLLVSNRKPKAVHMRIKKNLNGEVVSVTNNPKTSKTATGLRTINPFSKLEWDVTVDAGKSLKLGYSYKVYVRS